MPFVDCRMRSGRNRGFSCIAGLLEFILGSLVCLSFVVQCSSHTLLVQWFWIPIRFPRLSQTPDPPFPIPTGPYRFSVPVSPHGQQACGEKPDCDVGHVRQLRTFLGDGSGVSATGDREKMPDALRDL